LTVTDDERQRYYALAEDFVAIDRHKWTFDERVSIVSVEGGQSPNGSVDLGEEFGLEFIDSA